MPPNTPEKAATYLIQYPNARVELLVQELTKALGTFLHGPEPITEDSAHAASLFLDMKLKPIWLFNTPVTQAILDHHPDPDHYPVPSLRRSWPRTSQRSHSATTRSYPKNTPPS